MHDYIKQSNKLIWSLWLRKEAVNGYKMELHHSGMNSLFHLLFQKITFDSRMTLCILVGHFAFTSLGFRSLKLSRSATSQRALVLGEVYYHPPCWSSQLSQWGLLLHLEKYTKLLLFLLFPLFVSLFCVCRDNHMYQRMIHPRQIISPKSHHSWEVVKKECENAE